MTKEELNILLASDDMPFRKAAIDEIVWSFPEHADLFFAPFGQDDELALAMANAAKQWMLFLRDGYATPDKPFDAGKNYAYFDSMAQRYGAFLREMHKHHADQDALWHHFPGLRAELKDATPHEEPVKNRQLMVFVTGRCNLHCPYCFSKELKRMSISREDMTRVLDWAQRVNVKSILPCGGEPLLYEHMDWLIEEAGRRGLKVYFATNLSVPVPESVLRQESVIEELHVHLTEEIFRNEHLMQTFLHNLRLCHEKGIYVILRGNICEGNEMKWYDEWVRIAEQNEIHVLNVAFTIPSHTGSNRYVSFEALRPLIPHLHYLWEQAQPKYIRLSIAKPLPLCMLPDDLAQELLRTNPTTTYCNIGEDGGLHNLSLSTDLRFSPCLGVDEPSVAFADDLQWNDLKAVFSPAVRTMLSQPLFAHCKDCFLYSRNLCQGACLSFKQESRKGGASCGE